mmetsp:Transcript_83223/g.182860  ORF Transcript_83223/g.182860 Transcript_83223/m.182860 type:complete len:235 (-) Transcript_83223:110-814(-)
MVIQSMCHQLPLLLLFFGPSGRSLPPVQDELSAAPQVVLEEAALHLQRVQHAPQSFFCLVRGSVFIMFASFCRSCQSPIVTGPLVLDLLAPHIVTILARIVSSRQLGAVIDSSSQSICNSIHRFRRPACRRGSRHRLCLRRGRGLCLPVALAHLHRLRLRLKQLLLLQRLLLLLCLHILWLHWLLLVAMREGHTPCRAAAAPFKANRKRLRRKIRYCSSCSFTSCCRRSCRCCR